MTAFVTNTVSCSYGFFKKLSNGECSFILIQLPLQFVSAHIGTNYSCTNIAMDWLAYSTLLPSCNPAQII